MGGITSWSHQMARLFSERGHRVHVIGMLPLTREDADLWIRQRMDNVGFMPNPLPFFPDVPSDRSARCVVSIGRLHEEKGVDLLLEAWAQVAPRHPDWTLRIYGSGEEEDALRKLAAELGVAASVAWMGR